MRNTCEPLPQKHVTAPEGLNWNYMYVKVCMMFSSHLLSGMSYSVTLSRPKCACMFVWKKRACGLDSEQNSAAESRCLARRRHSTWLTKCSNRSTHREIKPPSEVEGSFFRRKQSHSENPKRDNPIRASSSRYLVISEVFGLPSLWIKNTRQNTKLRLFEIHDSQLGQWLVNGKRFAVSLQPLQPESFHC